MLLLYLIRRIYMKDNYINNCFQKILDANLYDVVLKTPLEYAHNISKRLKNDVYIKREDLQPIFSFKLRGAYNKISRLSTKKSVKKLVAASAGNHAQGVALSGKKLSIPVCIVMPKTTPQIKITAVDALNAHVILHGDTYDDAYDYARKISQKKGYEFIHPYDDIEVIAGQGTIAKEILEQIDKKPDYIFIPVGGGGLLAGISVYVKKVSPKTKIISVEPYDSNCFYKAHQAKKRIKLKTVGIFVDGVAVKQIGTKTFKLAKNLVNQCVLVTTDEICAGIKDLYEETRTIAEPAGALSIAGIKKFVKNNNIKGKTIISIFCGANMNFDRLRHVSERAETGELNEMLVGVTIPEIPGSFKRFCSLIGKRSITEFNYRYSHEKDAQVFAGIKLSNGSKEKNSVLNTLKKNKYKVIDLTDNEMAKLHIRYMVGGVCKSIKNEKIFRFIFPEKPGELLSFLNALGSRWNISLFHYRNHGADFGRVLVGLQIDNKDKSFVLRHLNSLNYEFSEETTNNAYKLFLS